MTDDVLKQTPLHGLHGTLGAKMVPFAGWSMPVSYPLGVIREHLHTRAAAGLFDVSHMGQVILRAPSGRAADAALALETLVPADIAGLAEGRQRYALFTNDAGGILDDLMVANRGDHLFLVVNAARADHDLAHMRNALDGIEVTYVPDRALLALQGPAAEAVLEPLAPGAQAMRFMDVATLDWDGTALWVSRSGYTGEDGYEISLPADRAEAFAETLLRDARVEAIGLGARDSLRLEAGLCLYGHDIDETTTPAEAALNWSIGKARREGGDRAGGFPGAARVLAEFAEPPARRRVGISPETRAPMREGTALYHGDRQVGVVTSGGFGPSVEAPVAMAYVDRTLADPGTALDGEVRGKRHPARVAPLPFIPPSFKR